MTEILAIRSEILSGNRRYPVYLGFLPARIIKSIADAPAFTKNTPNEEIARHLLNPPVKEWQRPLEQSRVQAIALRYNNSGEFMPNPVLLAENVLIQAQITVQPETVAGGYNTGLFRITVQQDHNRTEKPLWILDGQHRVSGVSASLQAENPVPFVLLINAGGSFFAGPDLAKIFAQVTTSAEPLDALHHDWLTYAFSLGYYEKPSSQPLKQAVKCAAELCRMSQAAGGAINNPFFNKIQFNHFLPSSGSPPPGGFDYNSLEFRDLLYKFYYNCATAGASRLEPLQLAEQIILAHSALARIVGASHRNSVFFGDPQHGQKIMQDSFLAGVMAHLLKLGIPANGWDEVLRILKFDITSWDFFS